MTRMSTQGWSGLVRQLEEEVIVQVPASSSSVDMRDFYFENLANSAENLHNLHQGAIDQVIHIK